MIPHALVEHHAMTITVMTHFLLGREDVGNLFPFFVSPGQSHLTLGKNLGLIIVAAHGFVPRPS
jgi:hypothetical protein